MRRDKEGSIARDFKEFLIRLE